MSYFCVDVEADGELVGMHSIVCFGAVKVADTSKTFYGKIRPLTDQYRPDALAVSGFSRQEHEQFDDPYKVMIDFEEWLLENSEGKPTFISDNPCLKYSTRVIVTPEFSFLPTFKKRNNTVEIGDIVKYKVNLPIPSYNISNNRIELKNITNWHRNEHDGVWVKIKTSLINNFSRFTKNHEFFIKEIGWVKAENLHRGDIVLQLDITPNDEQKQLLMGSLLGDGSLSRNEKRGKSFIVGHASEKYTKFKLDILGDLCINDIAKRTNNRGFSKKDGVLYSIHTKTLRFLKKYDKKSKDFINIIDDLNYIGLAFWYMDDGSLCYESILRLHTEGHDYDNNVLIAKKLTKKTNLNWKVVKCGRGNFCLTLSIKDTELFCNEICKYVTSDMEYKLIPRLRGGDKYIFNNKSIYDVHEEVITEIEFETKLDGKKYRDDKYCISVSDNNNFFTITGLVHNCFDWQWINWYMHKYCGRNLFGFSGRRIGDLYCGLVKDASKNQEWKRKYRITKHTHDPIMDALGNAEALIAFRDKLGLKIKF